LTNDISFFRTSLSVAGNSHSRQFNYGLHPVYKYVYFSKKILETSPHHVASSTIETVLSEFSKCV